MINSVTYGLFLVSGVLVIIEGFREKTRTRFNQCQHLPSRAACVSKWLFKAIVTIWVTVSVLYGLVCLMTAEAVLAVLLAAERGNLDYSMVVTMKC